MMNKFDSFQKKCLQWILSQEEKSYSHEVYISKCKQVDIPPLSFRFNFNNMNLFHKIVYKTIPVNIPDYITLYSEDSRLCRTHLDNLSFVSNIASTTTNIANLNKSFFFRFHTLWNSLPFDIRNSMRLYIVKLDSIKIVLFFLALKIFGLGLGCGWSLSIEQVYILN